MSTRQPSHDIILLDELSKLPEVQFDGKFWRVVHGVRSPIDGSKGAGRWNLRESEVIYCALEKDGALSEIHFHINRQQPIFPSKLVSVAYEMRARFGKVIDLTDMAHLEMLGVDTSKFQQILYDGTQDIGEAAGFLGFEAMIVPNARHDSNNLVVFPANCDLDEISTLSKTQVSWTSWRKLK